MSAVNLTSIASNVLVRALSPLPWLVAIAAATCGVAIGILAYTAFRGSKETTPISNQKDAIPQHDMDEDDNTINKEENQPTLLSEKKTDISQQQNYKLTKEQKCLAAVLILNHGPQAVAKELVVRNLQSLNRRNNLCQQLI